MNRNLLAIMIALALATGLSLIAQDHSNMAEKKASDEITLSMAVKVGKDTLEAGKYRIFCNREKMSFTRVSDGKKVLEVECKGKDLGQKSETTEVHTALDRSGARFVEKLYLRGSNVEHVFN
jgi:hypothetical protein